MTLVVVHEKNTHAMTLVDPCVVCEKNTHAMTLGMVHDMVCEKNTHAMTLVDPYVVCRGRAFGGFYKFCSIRRSRRVCREIF